MAIFSIGPIAWRLLLVVVLLLVAYGLCEWSFRRGMTYQQRKYSAAWGESFIRNPSHK